MHCPAFNKVQTKDKRNLPFLGRVSLALIEEEVSGIIASSSFKPTPESKFRFSILAMNTHNLISLERAGGVN